MQHLDAQSRWHVRLFAGQVAFLSLIGAPALLVDRHAPALYLLQLRAMFGFSALIQLVLAMIARQPLSPSRLCIWDHFLAFLLLNIACSLVLRMLG